ncbi:MAG: retropepsin-like domain-containing protein [Candidatus Eremiobacteraeota bacterium]|nr:retropepsin-like domain-containing protein [Candidatus Eremiobacteraeota bacterium]
MKELASRAIVLSLSLVAAIGAFAAVTHPASASASAIIPSGSNATRTTIPVTIDGERASCVLDTGTSAMIISPSLAESARLPTGSGTFEVAPDGRTYVDRETEIARFGVAGYALHNVSALISPNVPDDGALCGYDFFTHFPTLIDRDRRQVTLFPSPSKLARLHCIAVDLTPHVPLATIEINDTWLSHIVLDSGMAGGGALWDGVRGELRRPLVASANYETMPAAVHEGFACGSVASVRYAAGSAATAMPICTEPQRPDGYNGIIETNLPSVHAMAVDYPHRRICFDVNGSSEIATPETPAAPTTPWHDAWSRFNYYRPPKT